MRRRAVYAVAILCLAASGAPAKRVSKEEKEAFNKLRQAAKTRRIPHVEKWHLEWLKIRARPDCERVPGGKRLWRWLNTPSRDYLLTELVYAVPRLGDPLPMFRTFQQLWASDPKGCHVYPDLAVAFTTVWTRPENVRPFDDTKCLGATRATPPAPMLDSFAYYVQNARKLSCNPRRVPWQVLLYVANNTAPVQERTWALRTYAKLPSPYGSLYNEVTCDDAVGAKEGRPRMEGRAYTLANLKAHGGACSHRADYAEKVLRSLGIPAVSVRGKGRDGRCHVWIGWFEPARGGRRACRYRVFGNRRGDRFHSGNVLDPATGKWDAIDREIELVALALAQGAEPYRRARTLHRCYLGLYRLPENERLRLLTDAIDTNPYHGPAWRTVAGLCRRRKLSEARGQKLFHLMLRKLARFPDLTFRMLGDFATLLPPAEPRKINAFFARAYGAYRRAQRPDLAGRLKIAQGQFLAEAGHYEHAIKAMAEGARDFPTESRSVGRLAQGIGHICRQKKVPALGLKLLEPLLEKVPRHVRTEPAPLPNEAYIAVASELVSLYRTTGDEENARQIEKKIAALRGGK
jgi:hypothetical protein